MDQTTTYGGTPAMSRDDKRAVFAALLGWTMDAFDYFIVVLVYADIAADFGVSLTDMAFLTTATLIMLRYSGSGPTRSAARRSS